MLTRLVTLLLVVAITLTSSAQQPAGVILSKRAQAVKDKVSSLALQDHISVVPLHGGEQFGTYLSKDDASFTFFDVDRKMNATWKFTEVKKIKTGYGGYNYPNQGPPNHTRSLVVTSVIIATLVGTLLIAAVAARN